MRHVPLTGPLSSFMSSVGDEIANPDQIHHCFAPRIMQLVTAKGKAKAVTCSTLRPRASSSSGLGSKSTTTLRLSSTKTAEPSLDVIDLTTIDEDESSDYMEVSVTD